MVQQEPGALGCRDVAGNHFGVAKTLAELGNRALHHDRMAVRDVDHDDVHVGSNQLGRALEVVAGRADRGADAQSPLAVARRKWHASLTDDVARRDQADETPVRADQRELLDLALDHEALSRLGFDRSLVHDQPRDGGHAIRHARSLLRHEPHVAFGQQAGQPAPLVDHDERADTGARHQRGRLVQRRVGRDARGIRDHAVLRPFDDFDFADLWIYLPGPEPAIDDSDPPFFGLHDRHGSPRHGIHVRGDNRPLEEDAAGEAR